MATCFVGGSKYGQGPTNCLAALTENHLLEWHAKRAALNPETPAAPCTLPHPAAPCRTLPHPAAPCRTGRSQLQPLAPRPCTGGTLLFRAMPKSHHPTKPTQRLVDRKQWPMLCRRFEVRTRSNQLSGSLNGESEVQSASVATNTAVKEGRSKSCTKRSQAGISNIKLFQVNCHVRQCYTNRKARDLNVRETSATTAEHNFQAQINSPRFKFQFHLASADGHV